MLVIAFYFTLSPVLLEFYVLPLKSNNAPHDLARDDYGNIQIRIRNQGSGKTFYKLEMEPIIFVSRVF